MMDHIIENLFDIKGITTTLKFVFVVVVAFLIVDKLQESQIGQNKDSRGIIENAKNSISTLTDGYFLAEIIGSVGGFILLALWLKNKLGSGNDGE